MLKTEGLPAANAESGQVIARLSGLHPKLIDLSLERLERLLGALGDPHQNLPPVIHVAGTNGKGSTIALLHAMIEAAGLDVHVYTSPHLLRMGERIRLAGREISDPALAGLLSRCEDANAGQPITVFEIITAAAFLAFAESPADLLLLETGLGGRLDATNVVPRPLVTAITSVSLDHQQFLGHDLGAIAGEKAGILKPRVTAVVGPQEAKVLNVITARARSIDAPLSLWGEDWSARREGAEMVFRQGRTERRLPLPALAGDHQIENAAIALACLEAAPELKVDHGARAHGLAAARWPARLERLGGGPLAGLLPEGTELWLDGGHNPAAGRVLARALGEPGLGESEKRPLYIVAGLMKTKDAAGFLAPLAAHASGVACVAIPDQAACYGPDELARLARAAGLNAEPATGVGDALSRIAARTTKGSRPARVLICGSLYLAGWVLKANGETGIGQIDA